MSKFFGLALAAIVLLGSVSLASAQTYKTYEQIQEMHQGNGSLSGN
jgi:hypothetical protein